MLVVGSIVIRVQDLQRQLGFWTAALGYRFGIIDLRTGRAGKSAGAYGWKSAWLATAEAKPNKAK